jgi:hypothetical protein
MEIADETFKQTYNLVSARSVQSGSETHWASYPTKYRQLFPREYSGRRMNLAIHLHLVPWS